MLRHYLSIKLKLNCLLIKEVEVVSVWSALGQWKETNRSNRSLFVDLTCRVAWSWLEVLDRWDWYAAARSLTLLFTSGKTSASLTALMWALRYLQTTVIQLSCPVKKQWRADPSGILMVRRVGFYSVPSSREQFFIGISGEYVPLERHSSSDIGWATCKPPLSTFCRLQSRILCCRMYR